MMEEYLRAFQLFNEEEIAKTSSIASKTSLKKGDYFITEDNVCNKVAFVLSGTFRSFYRNENAEESTYCFTFPNNFLTAYSSLISQEPTKEYIQALTDAELLIITKHEIDKQQLENPKWVLFLKTIAEQQYIELEKRIFQLLNEKADTRYRNLITNHPEYIQQLPLQFVASYLGITQRHLSRLRKELVLSDKCPTK